MQLNFSQSECYNLTWTSAIKKCSHLGGIHLILHIQDHETMFVFSLYNQQKQIYSGMQINKLCSLEVKCHICEELLILIFIICVIVVKNSGWNFLLVKKVYFHFFDTVVTCEETWCRQANAHLFSVAVKHTYLIQWGD